jgi:hypothetical protein
MLLTYDTTISTVQFDVGLLDTVPARAARLDIETESASASSTGRSGA